MRIAITFVVCLGLLAFALLELPSGSRAFQTPPARSAALRKQKRQRFRPGEVLVRYRNESMAQARTGRTIVTAPNGELVPARSEEHTSELQSQSNLVCRLLL